MEQDFSHKINDATAIKISSRIPVVRDEDNPEELYRVLSEYAGLSYATITSIVSRVGLPTTPSGTVRLAYALIHYTPTDSMGAYAKTKCEAHTIITKVTADRLDSSNPKICLRFLLLSSPYAGTEVDYVMGIRDAVKLQKSIYSGRSRLYSGRSLLEFVGCRCTIELQGRLPVKVYPTKEERKLNKQLCQRRKEADTGCAKAPTCVLCTERRNVCALAVRC